MDPTGSRNCACCCIAGVAEKSARNADGGPGNVGLLMNVVVGGGGAGRTAAVAFPDSEKNEVSTPIGVERTSVVGAPETSGAAC